MKATTNWPGARIFAGCVVSFLALVLLGFHLAGNKHVDNTAMLLVLLFFLPWVLGIIDSFEGFGVKLKMKSELEPASPADATRKRAARASDWFAPAGQGRFDFATAEQSLLTALLKAGARRVDRDMVLVERDGSRIDVDAVAYGDKATYLVEMKSRGPSDVLGAVAQAERVIASYEVGRDCEHIFGLVVFANASVGAVREAVSAPVSSAVKLAVLNVETAEIEFVHPNHLD